MKRFHSTRDFQTAGSLAERVAHVFHFGAELAGLSIVLASLIDVTFLGGELARKLVLSGAWTWLAMFVGGVLVFALWFGFASPKRKLLAVLLFVVLGAFIAPFLLRSAP